tara:strand:- start:544 stop:2310 length:1767 start_codon:yes stop_codon:yes gene_type:complete
MKLKLNRNLTLLDIVKLIWENINSKRRRQVLFLLSIMFICGLSEIINLLLLKNFLTLINNPLQVNQELLIYRIVNFLKLSDLNISSITTIVFIISCIFTAFIRLLNLWLNGIISSRITSDVSCKVFSNIIYREYSEYVKDNTSKVLTKLSICITGLVNVLNYIFNIFSSIIIISIIFAGLCYVNFKISLISILLFGIIYFCLFLNKKSYLSKNSEFILKSGERQLRLIQNVLGSFRDVIINSNQDFFLAKYKNLDYSMRYKLAQNRFISASPRFILENIGFIFFALLTLTLIKGNEAIIPLVGIFALAAQKILPSMQSIFHGLSGIKSNSAYVRDIFEVINREEEFRIHKFKKLSRKINFHKTIEIRNLTFRYSKDRENVLNNINFDLKKGEHLGIVGKTGCGKSTLVDILMGLIKPDKGNIFIDKIELLNNKNDKYLNSWRSKIAHVPQQIFLVEGTILENIALGISNEQIDMAKVLEVIKIAKIEKFIEDLKNGIYTEIGERGILLSGGQIQRIGIARALYKNAEILVLDEATSALDKDTEKSLLTSLNNLKNKITIISITHRVSEFNNFDRIIELKNGNATLIKI